MPRHLRPTPLFTNSVYRLHSIDADERPQVVRLTVREVPNGVVMSPGARRPAEVRLRLGSARAPSSTAPSAGSPRAEA
jgi:hypothetical protein